MIFCEKCKALFDEFDLVVRKVQLEDDGWGGGFSEYEEGYCPYCDSYELDFEHDINIEDFFTDSEDYDDEDEDEEEDEEEWD